MNLRLSSAAALGALSLASCFPPEPPPYRHPTPYGAAPGSYRGDGYDGGATYDDGARYDEAPAPEQAGPPAPGPSAPSAPAPAPKRTEYPVAERTSNPNQVLSPYAPYNVIDVGGFKSGQLAKDPSNGKIFRIP